jgi:recombinational DNA repair protein (RecF pathway)
MYPIETTPGLIVSVVPRRDADLSFQIFTKEFGMVYAYAQSASKESSKLRGALPLYGLAEVSFVHGKAGYRLTAARLLRSHLDVDEKGLRIIAGMSRLIKILCPESEPNESLFKIISETYSYVSAKQVSTRDFQSLEIRQTAHVLDALGYWPSEHEVVLETSMDDLESIDAKRGVYIQVINSVLQSSHL